MGVGKRGGVTRTREGGVDREENAQEMEDMPAIIVKRRVMKRAGGEGCRRKSKMSR